MNHTAAIALTNENNRLNNFRPWTIAALFLLIVLAALYFAFDDELHATLVPYMPMTHGKSATYYHDLFRLGGYELLWTALLLAVWMLFYSWRSLNLIAGSVKLGRAVAAGRFLWLLCLAFATAVMVISVPVLQAFPNSSDEYVYLYQARTMTEGRLWEDSHPVEKSFGFNHIAIKDGMMVGRFPPGWPLVLALFLSAGVPAFLVGPLLALITLILFYRFAAAKYDDTIAAWASVAVTATSFFLFNSASYFSHGVCLLATVVFAMLFERWKVHPRFLHAAGAGVAIGLIAITRYYTAVLIFLPYVVYLVSRYKWSSWRFFIGVAVGATPLLVFLGWYNYSITGNVLEPVTVWAYRSEGIGFVNGHSVLKGLEHIGRRFLMFVYWCSPVLLVLYFYYLFFRPRAQSWSSNPEDYLFLSLVAGYFFYYEIGGNQYGPRFYYEAFPFMVLFVVQQVFAQGRRWARALFFAGLIVSFVRIPVTAVRERGIVDQRVDIYRQVSEQRISNAVILLSSGTSPLRPMPSGDLTRNDMRFSNDVLYAIDHIHANADLMRYYAGRRFYTYVREPDSVHGRITRIR